MCRSSVLLHSYFLPKKYIDNYHWLLTYRLAYYYIKRQRIEETQRKILSVLV